MQSCALCTKGPVGIEGHAALFVFSFSGAKQRFNCRDCGTGWTRSNSGDNAFTWHCVDALQANESLAMLPQAPAKAEGR